MSLPPLALFVLLLSLLDPPMVFLIGLLFIIYYYCYYLSLTVLFFVKILFSLVGHICPLSFLFFLIPFPHTEQEATTNFPNTLLSMFYIALVTSMLEM